MTPEKHQFSWEVMPTSASPAIGGYDHHLHPGWMDHTLSLDATRPCEGEGSPLTKRQISVADSPLDRPIVDNRDVLRRTEDMERRIERYLDNDVLKYAPFKTEQPPAKKYDVKFDYDVTGYASKVPSVYDYGIDYAVPCGPAHNTSRERSQKQACAVLDRHG